MNLLYEAKIERAIRPESWQIKHTDVEKTGIRLFSVEHPRPDIIPTTVWIAEPNSTIDIPSTTAWAGAKTSRSQASFDETFTEIHSAFQENPEFAAEKIAKFFEGYGHQSVADMAQLFLYINKIPIHLAFEIFYSMSVGAGQESSTRYIKFDNLGIDSPDLLFPMETISKEKADEIRVRWETLQTRMGENYAKWYQLAKEAYTQKFGDSVSEKTIDSRALDIGRLWIPAGATTSMALLMSTRDWVGMVRTLKETDDIRSKSLGVQILRALQLSETEEGKDISLKLGTLLKYNEPTYTITNNKEILRNFLMEEADFVSILERARKEQEETETIVKESTVTQINVEPGEGTVLQYIMELFPEMDEVKILSYLKMLPAHKKVQLGEIILKGHNRHDLMANKGDIRGRSIFSINSAVAYLRDINRHRALGRFSPFFGVGSTKGILSSGFNANHQIFQTEGLSHLAEMWNNDASMLYAEINDLFTIINEEFPDNNRRSLLRLLPLGHNAKLHVSGPPMQFNYFVDQRANEPGDFGYVHLAHLVLGLYRGDPYFTNMLKERAPLDLNSRKQFAQRK